MNLRYLQRIKMVICAIFGCSKRSGRDQVSFFRFPCAEMKRNYKFSDLIIKRQKVWISRIKREDLDNTKIKHARICSLHFISGKPSSLQDVENPDWAPSLNLGHGRVSNVTATVDRYQRRLARSKILQSEDKKDDEEIHSDEEENNSDQLTDEANPSTSYSKMDAAIDTEVTLSKVKYLEDIEKDYFSLKKEYFTLKKSSAINFANLDFDSFQDDAQINFYSGMVNKQTLQLLFDFVSHNVSNCSTNKLTSFQEFFLFLMKLRLNLQTQDLGYRFNISQETASRIFNKWLDIMYIKLRKIVFWPERNILLKTMPQSFKSTFEGHVAVVIDCFEIIINRPSSLLARALTWSNYKQRNTVKYLIGITPQGVISFISLGWGGRASDKYITENCGILNNLLPGDVVLADRGFNNLNSVGFYCAKLIVPASVRGIKQLNPVDVENTRKIASLRIHVERVIGQLRNKFHILKGELPIEMCITLDEVAQIDKIVHVCCALVNLMPSVVS